MPIVSLSERQVGSGVVRVTCVDHLGASHELEVLSPGLTDAERAAIRANLEEDLARWELEANVRDVAERRDAAAQPTTQHCTVAQLRRWLREHYSEARGERALRMAAYLNTLGDAALSAVFGVSGAQLTALKNRLQARTDALSSYKVQGTGE